jgi:hypothetical protein
MSTGTSRCFAVRRVNPFVGVQQVLEAPHGRAISTDGVHWDLAIRADRPRVLGALERDPDGRAFIGFGRWSVSGGHAIASSRTVLMRDAELREKFDHLVAETTRHQPEVPFPLHDSEELWLFDETGSSPLALLATRLPGRPATEPEPPDWRCSPMGAPTIAQGRFAETRQLEGLVKRHGGFNIRKGWVSRQPDGSGLRDCGATPIEAHGARRALPGLERTLAAHTPHDRRRAARVARGAAAPAGRGGRAPLAPLSENPFAEAGEGGTGTEPAHAGSRMRDALSQGQRHCLAAGAAVANEAISQVEDIVG